MTLACLIGAFFVPVLISLVARTFFDQPHWQHSSHESTNQAPAPAEHPHPVAQVYAARTWGLRGAVAVHTWLAVKRADAERYTRHEVIGWRLRTGTVVVSRLSDAPDGQWYSNPPRLLADLRGPEVGAVIDKIEAAVAAYPHRAEYKLWPGPNSNTFTAHIGRSVPELGLDLPPTAIGKDYLVDGAIFGFAPSRTGWQLSLYGAAGILVALREGVEINLLGLSAGVRFWPPALRMPGLGTWPRRPS